MNNKLIYVNSDDKLILFDLKTKKKEPLCSFNVKNSRIEGIQCGDNHILFRTGHACFELNPKNRKYKKLLTTPENCAFVDFTRPFKDCFIYSINHYPNYPEKSEGKVCSFNLKSKNKTLLSDSGGLAGRVAFNGSKVSFTNIIDDHESLISLRFEEGLIKFIENICSLSTSHLYYLAMNDKGGLSFLRKVQLFGDAMSYRFYKKETIRGMEYLEENKLIIGGRFVESDRLGEEPEVWDGFLIMQNGNIKDQIEVDDRITCFSLLK